MHGYMLDTMIFNRIMDGNIDISIFKKENYFITHIQQDELQNTKDAERRKALNHTFNRVINIKLPTESFLLGTSRLNDAKLGDDSVLKTESAIYGTSKYGNAKYSSENNQYNYALLKTALDKKKRHKNNQKDALIAETAVQNNLILITEDQTLFDVMTELGCKVQKFSQLLADLEVS